MKGLAATFLIGIVVLGGLILLQEAAKRATGAPGVFDRGAVWAAETATVSATVQFTAGGAVSVIIDENSSVNYLVLQEGASQDTTLSGINASPLARNNGTATSAWNIIGRDSDNWSLSTVDIGADIYMNFFCISSCDASPVWATIDLSAKNLFTGVIAAATRDFDLMVQVPNPDNSSNGATQDTGVTVQAVAE